MKSQFGASLARAEGRSGLAAFRRYGAPIAGTTLFFFLESAFAPALAWAQSGGAPPTPDTVQATDGDRRASVVQRLDAKDTPEFHAVDAAPVKDPAEDTPVSEKRAESVTKASVQSAAAVSQAAAEVNPPPAQLQSLPTGGDKSGVTSKAISLPQGSGKIQGMGESFSAQLSTGIATFSVPFALAHARGGAQPSLGLSYSSSGGFGLAGVGWDVGVPFIARQTDRGLPSYTESSGLNANTDGSGFDANQDRFVFNGGQELVPICVVGAAPSLPCAGALSGEAMPSWSEGAQYFRARVEGSFLRFFWSGDHKTWRVQDKSGITMELGVPLDAPTDTAALDANPQDGNQIYRWHLVRQYDTYGTNVNPSGPTIAPTVNNVVIYKYLQNGGLAYLSDIYDTSPANQPTTRTLSLFAHHTHLKYEPRTDPTFSFHSGWRMDQTLRLTGVDVTSKGFNESTTSARHMVRRYHLAYDSNFHASLLASVQVEGRCTPDEAAAPSEVAELLPATSCGLLPAMKFEYSHVPGAQDLPGYEAFDDTVHAMSSSPTVSVDNETADLLDINSDALPDVLDTAVGNYGPGHGVFFNSPGGKVDSFSAAVPMSVSGVLGANANTITFRNPNLAALDLNGDGTIDLLHMPQIKTYASYAPVLQNGAWSWVGHAVTTASGQSPKIDFGNDTVNTKVVDVNGDGLVDVLVSTGTEYETFLSLGRLPQGDGQFGNGSFQSATIGHISNEPLRKCVPWSSTPLQLSDPDVKLADMNGDGLTDLVRVRRGDIRYWPGRGDGTWGTGDRSACLPNTFSSNGAIAMSASPEFSDIQQAALLVDDVNGDGLDDLVEVLNTAPSGTSLKGAVGAIEVWLNVDGKSWTKEHIQATTFPFMSRVRLVDVNGSGTRDVFSASGGRYAYIDLQGGIKPWLLTGVSNGLGKSTSIEYSTSTEEMLAAESLPQCDATTLVQSPWGCRWQSKMPMVAHVVKRVTESDNISTASGVGTYVTEYQYRDPLFEGRQREFRGFARARSKKIGDINSPSSFTDSAFLLGECEDETPNDGGNDCDERWRDNPREALKGLPIFTTTYDEQGVTLSTDYSTYRLRTLYTGMDGRGVRQAFESDKQAILYDTARGPQSGGAPLSFSAVYREVGSTPVPARTESVPVAASAGTATMHSASVEDYFGNKTEGIDYGCVSGDACPVAGNGIAAEEVLHGFTDPGTAPLAGNTGNWLWRTRESYVTGEAHPGVKRSDVKTTYNDQGAPTSTQALLVGGEALDRYHTTTGAALASNPTFQSIGTFKASELYYDAFGNVTSELGPDGMDVRRCRQVSYEGSLASQSYAEAATSETSYVGGCTITMGTPTGQGTSLTTTAMYDRGLGVVVSAMDMTAQTTLAKYDEFGRISEVRRPHANGTLTSPSDTPSVAIDYTLPSDSNPVPYSVIHTKTQDGALETDSSYLESFSYVDGLGRTRVALNEADPSAGDDSGWIASSIVDYDAKGGARRKYLAYFSTEQPQNFKLGATPAQPYARQRYDAFDRQLQTYDLDGTVALQSVYHALSTDLYDAADLESGPHQGTYASSTKDGHGRAIATTERIHAGSNIETREVRTQYLPTGEPEVITRYSPGKTPVVRWMRYDSLGRMTLNVDPHTSYNFTTDRTVVATPSTSANSTTTLRTWRYAYNNAGDLIGTSDARGCGENFTYDGAGRLKSEDYSPCNSFQGVYTAPVVSSGAGYEVLYYYDNFTSPNTPSSLPAGVTPTGYAASSDYLKGRLAVAFDRGQATWTTYDARGRVVQTDKRLAKPLTTASLSASITQVLGSQLFSKAFAYDAADREVRATTGAQSAELLATPSGASAAESAVTTTYTARGAVKKVSSSYGDLVTSVVHSADGLVKSITYGDAAATETNNTYDTRRRLYMVETERTPPGIWSNTTSYTPAPAYGGTPAPPPTTFQSTLQFNRYTYDIVGNPTQIEDLRVPEEWPAGAKPVTRKVEYDDLYRATKVSYQYSTGDDTWVSPDAPDLAGVTDVRRAQPMPHVTFTTRPRWQSYQYDWLGTISNSDDDQHASYDRSLGPVTTNAATGKPYQLASATQPVTGTNITGTNTRAGSVSAVYDRAGYATQINLTRATTVPCVPSSACQYRVDLSFDEVGRLQWAKRWNGSAYALSLYYQYDASDERVSKVSVDSVGTTRDTEYVFGSLELHRTTYNATTGVYDLKDAANANLIYEVPYLEAHGVRLGRVAYDSTAGPDQPHFTATAGGGRLHVFFELGDHLGSTSAVLDKDTGELVELGTYQPYGATESDYRPDRWQGFREDYRFTGKEEDIEVGLEYFGQRYLSPYLGSWISPDPLTVHGQGQADLNLYAYVHGAMFRFIDELGLDVTLIIAAQKTSAPRSGDAHKAAELGISVPTLVARRVGDDKNFANRAEQLKRRLEKGGFTDVVVSKPETGWKLVDKMETASSIAPIKNLVIYSHATPQNIVMRENAGLFRGEAWKKADVIDQGGEQQGVAYLDDIKKKMDAGQIKFSEDATIVLVGCNCGGKFDVKSGKAAPDAYSFAAELAKTTGARVIASVGGSDQSKSGTDLAKENSPNGGWFVFDKDSPAGRALEDGSNCSKGTCQTMQPEKYIKK